MDRPGLGGTTGYPGRLLARLADVSPYVVVAGVVLAGLLLFVAAMAASRLLAPSAPTPEKLTTYECGVDPVGEGWAQTHVRYYLYAFLYVVFAVDAVYLFPWATVFAAPAWAARRWSRWPSSSASSRRPAPRLAPRPAAVGLRGRPDADLHCRCRRSDRCPSTRPRPIKLVLNWGRRYSLWVFNFGLACCAIEFIAASMARHDFIRLGVIPFAPGPRQADLMVVSGTVTDKMAPAVRRLYDQMPEPKYVISFGACSNSGGPYWDSYCVTKGVDQLIPVDVYVPGCPPRPEALLQGILRLQEKIAGEDAQPPRHAGRAYAGSRRAAAARGHPPAAASRRPRGRAAERPARVATRPRRPARDAGRRRRRRATSPPPTWVAGRRCARPATSSASTSSTGSPPSTRPTTPRRPGSTSSAT